MDAIALATNPPKPRTAASRASTSKTTDHLGIIYFSFQIEPRASSRSGYNQYTDWRVGTKWGDTAKRKPGFSPRQKREARSAKGENPRSGPTSSYLLRAQNIPVEPVLIIARTGWTCAELSRGIAAAATPTGPYDLVSLLIGVNNQYRGYPLDEYHPEFRALLNQAIDFAGGAARAAPALTAKHDNLVTFFT